MLNSTSISDLILLDDLPLLLDLDFDLMGLDDVAILDLVVPRDALAGVPFLF